jgi:beta-lactamase regulating signal transducer with metallopeptidase domain
VPRTLLERLPGRDLRIVIAHELAHLRRRDLWTQVLTTSLLAIWWFHPIYWVLLIKVRRVCEDCCDDDVISRGFATPDEYCAALLHTSAALGSNRFNLGASLAFAESLHPIAGRLRRIMEEDIPRPNRISTPSRLAIAATAARSGSRAVKECGLTVQECRACRILQILNLWCMIHRFRRLAELAQAPSRNSRSR